MSCLFEDGGSCEAIVSEKEIYCRKNPQGDLILSQVVQSDAHQLPGMVRYFCWGAVTKKEEGLGM